MYLNRLEIIGFKSFADKTKIEFEEGLTAVIGPNGSGKSNITDAIRWVLGEQSPRSLRGSKMEDVIFSGSETRKALGYAEVSLTVDNSDQILPLEYNEVTITRRVYRSGESQYFINKTSCRRRDIQELFLDTGVGRDSFSLVGQGQVDALLNAKPEDRRILLEEAAGISRYKLKKETARAKLLETEQSLIRVRDILGELDRQLGPLKAQAAKAQEAKGLNQQLSQSSLRLDLDKLFGARLRQEEATKVLTACEDHLAQALAQTARLEAQSELTQAEKRSSEEAWEELQASLYQIQKEREQLLGHERVLGERLNSLETEERRLRGEISELEATSEAVQADVEYIKGELEAGLAQAAAAGQDLQELQAQFQVAQEGLTGLRNQIEDAKDRLMAVMAQGSEAENRRQSLHQQQERLRQQGERLGLRRQRLTQQMGEVQSRGEAQAQRLAEAESRLAELLEDLQTRRSILTSLRQERDLAGKALSELESRLRATQNRVELLGQMEKGYEGYYEGVKALLGPQGPGIAGLVGTVAELIAVPTTLQRAVEAALGAGLQQIVTDDDQAAQRSIEYLKAHKAGRATFLPLNLLKSSPYPEAQRHLLGTPGILGLASEMVGIQSGAEAALESLLGRVVIAEGMPQAVAFAKASGSRYKVVTLDGEVINPGGSMSGGASRNERPGLLQRKQEREDLEERAQRLAQELEVSTQAQATRGDQLAKLEAELEAGRTRSDEMRVGLVGCQKDLEVAVAEARRLAGELEALDLEEAGLGSELADLAREAQAVGEAAEPLHQQEADLRLEIQGLNESLAQAEAEVDRERQELTEMRVASAQAQEALSQVRRDLQRIEAESLARAESIREKESRILENQAEVGAVWAQVAAAQERAGVLGEEQTGKEQGLEALRARRQALQDEIARLEEGLHKARQEQSRISGQVEEAKVALAKVEVQLETVIERLAEAHAGEELVPAALEEPERINLEVECRRLRDRLATIGPVNPKAVEEYEAVRERHAFLKGQVEDLEQAAESLEDVISEIDRTTRKRFSQTFEEVNRHFGEIFIGLFGGGRARLELEGEDPLTAGVEVRAQLPGKRLQHLSLLSGGEKAMTAIALLFAVLKVRPAPFYVLDEIDAPLDEANLERFSGLLQELSKEAQFIVITHRRRTMESVGTLYGVTMEEKGVSKLISVRLKGGEV